MKLSTKIAVLAFALHACYGCGSLCPDAGRGGRVLAAAWAADAKTMRELLDAGSPPDGTTCNINSRAQTPLHIAAWHGDSETVKLLLAHGATVDSRDRADYIPLHLATGHEEVVALLIAAHANVNARTKEGVTPLSTAARNGQFVTVKYLLAAGADANAGENDGWTALHLAA